MTTHGDTHTGLTKAFRVADTAPTDPTPEAGDIYVLNTSGTEAIGIHNESTWAYFPLT